MIRKIKKVLVANRGEIAVRVIRTCREMQIPVVAVYSDIDVAAPHVRLADAACRIGPAPARESYLNIDGILDAARQSGADAIHPGYGFLSENAGFVDRVESEGLTFIGPKASQIRQMGDKTAARKLARALDVPIVPGTTEPVASEGEAVRIGREIGYPILLKAAGGGGGKGMRIVHSPEELPAAMKASRSEASSSFADDRIYIEKYIENPRHIEVQVLGDVHGNVIHLGERECSIQRRHQKIIEESPSAALDEDLRARITSAAVRLARGSGYVNAGTMEFMLDGSRNFFFLEMNTRLQVEHPVTEMRVGIDLVREQILIASGAPLSYRQEDIHWRGHAIECRLYAEDPSNNFYPSTGEIAFLQPPGGFGIREDRGIEQGSEVTAYYDPLLSKLIAWGATRDEAIRRMASALEQYSLYGVRNNLLLCRWIMRHEKFLDGDIDTNFLVRYPPRDLQSSPPPDVVLAGIIGAAMRSRMLPAPRINHRGSAFQSKWRSARKDVMGGVR